MAELLSNHLKAVVVLDDVRLTNFTNTRDQFFTVQRFEYRCERSRDERGLPFGSTLSVVLKASVKATTPDTGKVLYEWLSQNARFSMSFLFDATFDGSAKLADFGSGMVMNGYVVDIEETHNRFAEVEIYEQQMLIEFSFLVSSITYLGRESNKSLYIIHNCE